MAGMLILTMQIHMTCCWKMDKYRFYCATIAYHVELNAYLGGRRHLANVQEKWTYNSGEMPLNRGDPSSDVAIHFLFMSWLQIWNQYLFIVRKEI